MCNHTGTSILIQGDRERVKIGKKALQLPYHVEIYPMISIDLLYENPTTSIGVTYIYFSPFRQNQEHCQAGKISLSDCCNINIVVSYLTCTTSGCVFSELQTEDTPQ